MKDYLILESLELSELIEKTLRKVLEEHQAPDPALRETPAEIISIDQAVELLNLAKPTIYALTSRGEIPFFKTGKKLYFKRSELLAWIEQGKKGAHIGQPAKKPQEMRPEQFDIRSLPFSELVQDVVRLNEHDRQTLQSWLDSIERKGGRPDQKTEERLQHLQTRIDFIGELAGRLSCLDYCLGSLKK